MRSLAVAGHRLERAEEIFSDCRHADIINNGPQTRRKTSHNRNLKRENFTIYFQRARARVYRINAEQIKCEIIFG